MIVIHVLEGQTATWIARSLKVCRNTVYRTRKRYEMEGEAGLFDRRSENGERKVTEEFLERLAEVVAGDPQQYGWKRPTWTRELLIQTMARLTGVSVALSTMSRALRQIGARRGRPKPTAACPWPEAEKERRLQEIHALIANLPADEVAVYEDEIDIRLNPKIGQDGMLRGQQQEAPTPGQNQKRSLAGADVRTGELISVAGAQKRRVVRLSVAGTGAAVSSRPEDSRDSGQFLDPYDENDRVLPANVAGAPTRPALSPALLPGP